MKFIRIFLLVLIIIGIILLCTQNIWVPKLVDKIIKYQGTPIIVQATSTPIRVKSTTPVKNTDIASENNNDSEIIFSKDLCSTAASSTTSLFNGVNIKLGNNNIFPGLNSISMIDFDVLPIYSITPVKRQGDWQNSG